MRAIQSPEPLQPSNYMSEPTCHIHHVQMEFFGYIPAPGSDMPGEDWRCPVCWELDRLQACVERERFGASLPENVVDAAIEIITQRGRQVERLGELRGAYWITIQRHPDGKEVFAGSGEAFFSR